MLSEHFVDLFDWPMADTRHFREEGFTTLIGCELHAPLTSAGELWHIVAAGLPLDFAPCGKEETGVELARRARDAGAFIGIAHPSWSQLTLEDGLALESAHAVEIYNHGCEVETARGYGTYLHDQLLNEGKKLTCFATDDAHFRDHDRDAFGGWVHVKSESLDPDQILQGLKEGNYYSSQGPVIHDISFDGENFDVECSPVHTVCLVGGTSRSVVVDGRDITRATLNLEKIENGWIATHNSPWLQIILIDHAGRKAWSNPIWRDELPKT